jgi:RimJ/RimL family protein N-acetyltransferase
LDRSLRIKSDIVPYTDEYAHIVWRWIDSEQTYRYVSRGKEFPPSDDIVESWQRDEVKSYILLAENRPVAYGELWNRSIEMALEIAHVLVDPAKRGKGYGTNLIQLLYDRAASRPDIAKVMLNIYNDNEIALCCAMKTGFELVSTANYTVGLKMMRMVR